MGIAKIDNQTLMSNARESLNGKWGLNVGATLLYMAVVVGVQLIPKVGGLISFAITGAMMLGYFSFNLSIARNQEATITQLFDGFDRFVPALCTYLLQILFILLWMLLLIIPGIIAAFSYSMAFYILSDNKDMAPLDVLKTSKQMMDGNKAKLFFLSLRFIGWMLLCVLTAGIGFLWFFPYANVSMANFYNDIKDADNTAELITHS